jgi:hypothetical protein
MKVKMKDYNDLFLGIFILGVALLFLALFIEIKESEKRICKTITKTRVVVFENNK